MPPHPYGSEALLDSYIGTTLENALSTRDSTTTAADTLAECREKADNEIDAAFAQVYEVPFATYPSTPGIVKDISDYLTLVHLLERHPDLAKIYQDKADKLIERIVSGVYEIPGAAKVDASEGSVGLARLEDDGATPLFAGTDDDGDDRMGGW